MPGHPQRKVSSGTPPADSGDVARRALEALPLATEEAAVMRNRLANARSYLEAGERGAASYELRLLACSLCSAPLPNEAEHRTHPHNLNNRSGL
jgi:hypothetical protein